MVIANSGQSSLAIQLGGKYAFNHCTFGNYWTNSFRTFPTVTLDNSLPISDTEILVADLIEANFNNCIIYGSEQKEVAFVEDPSAAFNFNFTNCLIRFEDSQGDFDGIPNYDFENPALFTDCIFNLDPIFQDVTVNNLNIEEGTSGAQGIGLGGIMPPFDLNGTARDGNSPDAGAYEATIFPVED